MRRDVATVGEGVDERALRHPLASRELEQSTQVLDVRVNAAVGDESEQMDVPGALTRPLERATERLVLEERSGLDRAVHPHEVLVDDPPGADRQVPDLRVPHLAVREPDRQPGRASVVCGKRAPEVVEDRRVRELDRVPRPRRRATPAVEDDERYDWIRLAVSHTDANDSSSSDAPPIKAPSTSGWTSSSSALSGFTEPP